MVNKLECMLNDFPKKLINEVMEEQIRNRLRQFFVDERFKSIIDKKIDEITAPILFLKTKEYIIKNSEKIVSQSIKCYFDDFELSDKISEKISDMLEKMILKKIT